MKFEFIVGAIIGLASVIIACFLKDEFKPSKPIYKNRYL
jgi:hypothetical protein